jgi:amidohydrolase
VQSSGGEDFSWYGDHAPAGFIRLGVHTPGEPLSDIHTGGFDVDERSISIGARILAGAALEGLAALADG